MSVKEATVLLTERLINIFRRGTDGRIPAYGYDEKLQHDPNFQGLYLFFEYFHGDLGAGLGANHQTGWTGLVADLIEYWYKYQPENALTVSTEK